MLILPAPAKESSGAEARPPCPWLIATALGGGRSVTAPLPPAAVLSATAAQSGTPLRSPLAHVQLEEPLKEE